MIIIIICKAILIIIQYLLRCLNSCSYIIICIQFYSDEHLQCLLCIIQHLHTPIIEPLRLLNIMVHKIVLGGNRIEIITELMVLNCEVPLNINSILLIILPGFYPPAQWEYHRSDVLIGSVLNSVTLSMGVGHLNCGCFLKDTLLFDVGKFLELALCDLLTSVFGTKFCIINILNNE